MLEVTGEVDLSTAPTLRTRLDHLLRGGARRVLVNLEDVTFMDSSGLSVLVSALKELRESEGEMSVACSNASIMKVFAVTGLDRVLRVHGSVAEAVG